MPRLGSSSDREVPDTRYPDTEERADLAFAPAPPCHPQAQLQHQQQRRIHNAYSDRRCSGSRWGTIVALCVVGLILRNASTRDYRSELIDQLKQSGRTPEEIERWFPKTYEERLQKVRDDKNLLEALHKEVAALRVEVDEIKRQLEIRTADKQG